MAEGKRWLFTFPAHAVSHDKYARPPSRPNHLGYPHRRPTLKTRLSGFVLGSVETLWLGMVLRLGLGALVHVEHDPYPHLKTNGRSKGYGRKGAALHALRKYGEAQAVYEQGVSPPTTHTPISHPAPHPATRCLRTASGTSLHIDKDRSRTISNRLCWFCLVAHVGCPCSSRRALAMRPSSQRCVKCRTQKPRPKLSPTAPSQWGKGGEGSRKVLLSEFLALDFFEPLILLSVSLLVLRQPVRQHHGQAGDPSEVCNVDV